MGIADELDSLGASTADLVRAELKVANRDRRIRDLEAAVRALTADLDEARRTADITQAVIGGDAPPPRWLTPPRNKAKRGARRATVVLMLSDLHLDETVNPAEMQGVNQYDRRIAELRLARVIDKTISITKEIFPTLTIDGAVCLSLGDTFSGDIHDELRETQAPILDTLLHWQPLIAGAFDQLAGAFGKLHVAHVCGNHGRMTKKPRAKQRATTNYEWLAMHNVARSLAGSKQVTFDIPQSPDTMVNVYDTRIRCEHGDAYRGGGGIAGLFSPLLLGIHRTTRQAMAEGRPFDVCALGHWHQVIHAPSKGLLVNGSLKGPDEYSRSRLKAEPEDAQQHFFLVTPEHGISFSAPILAVDRKAEGW